MQDDVRKLKGRLFWSSVDALRGDYTWRDIADTCGTTESTLGMMRMRGVLPRADVVVAIAKFLHVTVEILMDEEDRGRVRPRQA